MTAPTEFEAAGALRFKAALNAVEVAAISNIFGEAGGAGRRLTSAELAPVAHLLREDGAVGAAAASLIGGSARPVRAIAFDKSPTANWRLGWHQDRVIAVRERVEVEGFGGWSSKAGQPHVQPPIEVIANMVTLRIHVDAVDQRNAPLLILAGSHKLGRLSDERVAKLAETTPITTCIAGAGDIWAYVTSIVHSSAEQLRPGRRRVLQVDYSADRLPGGLDWHQLV